MSKIFAVLVAGVLALTGLARVASAEEYRISLPAEAQFVVRVDLPAVRSSTVGGRLFETAKSRLLAELADKGKGDLTLDKIVEILGFDPFEEVQGIVVGGAYENPEQSLVAAVQLRKTSGNLEGLLLTLPGYSAEEVEGMQIYSATPDENRRVFGTIHVNGAGDRTLVISAQRDAIVQALKSLDGQTPGDAQRTVTLGAPNGPLAQVDVFELPPMVDQHEGPPANIAKIVRQMSAQVSESDGKVNLATRVEAGTEKQSEQLEQMVKGLAAMVSLAASSEKDDQDLQQFQKWLSDLVVSRSGSTVELRLSLPADEVQRLIDENLMKD